MVLHNSKWDRRAKSKYLKKHGLSSEDAKKQSSERKSKGRSPERADEKSSEPEAEFNNDIQAGQEEQGQDDMELAELEPGDQTVEGIDQFPEYEENDEQDNLIREYMAKHTPKTQVERPHIQAVDRSVFEQAEADVERSKLNQRVRNIGTSRKNQHIDIDSDSDFDDFMDNLDKDDEAQASSATQHNAASLASLESSSTTQAGARGSRMDFLDKLLK